MNKHFALVRYDAARHALAEASRIDDVKDIRNKAVAMRVYGQQAQEHGMIDLATDIRFRAEIKAGEMLAEMAQREERAAGHRPKKMGSQPVTQLPKLSDLKISKMQSSRWQKLAGLSEEEQEAKLERAKATAHAAIDGTKKVRGTQGTGEFERYTPKEYIEAVRSALGEIDLDPATSKQPQSWIQAKRY